MLRGMDLNSTGHREVDPIRVVTEEKWREENPHVSEKAFRLRRFRAYVRKWHSQSTRA